MEKVKGIAMWANVQKANTRFDDAGVWQIDIEVDKEEQKRLTDMGLNLIEKANGAVIFRPKRKCVGKNGPNEKPLVLDKFGKTTDQEVGNGSEVEVAFRIFDYKKIEGIGADLEAVKINKLVPYSRDAKSVFEFEKDVDATTEENPFD